MIDEVINQFHSYILTEKRLAFNTFLAYKRDIEQFNTFLKSSRVGLNQIGKKDLSAFLKQLRAQKLSAKSISRKISTLKLFFQYLSTTLHLPNVAKTLTFPKIEKKLPTYLTEQEIESLLSAANGDHTDKGIRNKVMLYLLYATGIRVSELVNLQISDIEFNTGFMHVLGKGNKERLIPLPKNIIDLMSFYINTVYPRLHPTVSSSEERKQFLFAAYYNHKIKPISRQSFWISLKKMLLHAAISKNISPHSLRHSLATHLLQKGADLRSLQMLLGHQNLSTVQIYTHLSNNHIRKIYDKKHPRA